MAARSTFFCRSSFDHISGGRENFGMLIFFLHPFLFETGNPVFYFKENCKRSTSSNFLVMNMSHRRFEIRKNAKNRMSNFCVLAEI